MFLFHGDNGPRCDGCFKNPPIPGPATYMLLLSSSPTEIEKKKAHKVATDPPRAMVRFSGRKPCFVAPLGESIIITCQSAASNPTSTWFGMVIVCTCFGDDSMAGSQISPCFLKDGAGGDMNFISLQPRAPVPHLTATATFFGPWYRSANSEALFVRALSLFCLYLREDCRSSC